MFQLPGPRAHRRSTQTWRWLVAIQFSIATAGCTPVDSGSSELAEIAGATMGTRYSIKCWGNQPAPDGVALQRDVDRLLQQINQQMSTYLEDSELSQFNAAPAGDWFAVSDTTAFVTERALHYYRMTHGTSDVTVGPLVKLWDFGPRRRSTGTRSAGPSAEQLADTKARTGGEHLESRRAPPALRKTIDHLEVDLSSIAKGYAVDAVSELLSKRGFTDSMVEIGGEVRAAGTRLDGKPWRIGVEVPGAEERSIHRVISLQDQALATSGDYRNFRVINGQKISHIIDPRTGHPLPYRGWSVTLLTPTCLEADAIATALLVMGEDKGYDWCVEHHMAALFLLRQGDEVVEKATPLFSKWTAGSKPDQER